MTTNDGDLVQLLIQSQERTRLLLEDLLEYRSELAKHVDREKGEPSSTGLQAVDRAIQTARKMGQDIEEALQKGVSKAKERGSI